MTTEQVLEDLKELKQIEILKVQTGLHFSDILRHLKTTFSSDPINTLPSKRTPLQLEAARFAAEAANINLIL